MLLNIYKLIKFLKIKLQLKNLWYIWIIKNINIYNISIIYKNFKNILKDLLLFIIFIKELNSYILILYFFIKKYIFLSYLNQL